MSSDLPAPMLDAIKSESKSRQTDMGTYHVTEVLYCLQKAGFTRAALETRRLDDKQLRNFSWSLFRGQIFHKAFQPMMGDGVKFDYDWDTKDGRRLKLIGEADWMEDDDGTPRIGELKTVKNRWWYSENGVGPEHKAQVAAYLYMFNEKNGWLPTSENKPLLDAAFYYLDMDDILRIPITYTIDELNAVFEEMKNGAEVLDMSLRSRSFSDLRLDWRKSWQCNPKYCNFTEFCHQDYPLDPPPEHPDLEKWYAGPMKVEKYHIANNLLPVKTVWAILDEAGYKVGWRKRDATHTP